ncbi:MAG: MerR family transcriptional regulator [Caldilineaceae bacterium]|nr:MerR family transcriptional regulator [Caldilineaceae bacterium]
MKSSPDAPTFNLKAVVQETGLKPDTLRAWERRYGLPEPQRTDSGHRLYSQKDIQLLKWLIARQEEGMSISRAVELWRRLDAEGSNPQQAITPEPGSTPPSRNYTNATQRLHLSPTLAPTAENGSDTMAQAREAWIAACLRFDEQQAERIVSQTFGVFSVERVCFDLFQKGLATIGEGWYAGQITVQQEHFASALAVRRMEALMAATPLPTRAGRILVGCPPEEGHTFAPLILSLLLRRRGWDVLFLGADIPVQDFVTTTQTARPNFVVLTAQQLFTAASLRELSDLLYQVRIPMAFGGMIFTRISDLHTRITGHYLGPHIEEAVQRVEDLLFPIRLSQPALPLTQQYEEALFHFRQQQASIEAELWRTINSSGLSPTMLHKATFNFSRNITAALQLGNIDYLGVDLHWIQGLLTNHYQMPQAIVARYLASYLAAAEKILNSSGSILIQWLKRILTQANIYTHPLTTTR